MRPDGSADRACNPETAPVRVPISVPAPGAMRRASAWDKREDRSITATVRRTLLPAGVLGPPLPGGGSRWWWEPGAADGDPALRIVSRRFIRIVPEAVLADTPGSGQRVAKMAGGRDDIRSVDRQS
jgi:hypothetical protein